MKDEKTFLQNDSETDPSLLRLLDSGLEDIAAKQTLPHSQAMEEIRRIRDIRRQERSSLGAAANA